MNDKSKQDEPLDEKDRDIFNYLDTMLTDLGAEASGEEETNVLPKSSNIAKSSAPIESGPDRTRPQPESKVRVMETKPHKLVEKPVAILNGSLLRGSELKLPPNTEEETITPEVVVQVDVPASKEPPAETVSKQEKPQWATERFECLIFTVAGLKLAVPLVSLGSIHQIDRKFNALPGQYDWFLGILQTPNSGNIKVLDTARWVMPERYDASKRDSLAFVITIHGQPWGLACHGVEQSITLQPEQVKWRGQRGKRPWLAGTVVDHMCSLIDTQGFNEIISLAEQP